MVVIGFLDVRRPDGVRHLRAGRETLQDRGLPLPVDRHEDGLGVTGEALDPEGVGGLELIVLAAERDGQSVVCHAGGYGLDCRTCVRCGMASAITHIETDVEGTLIRTEILVLPADRAVLCPLCNIDVHEDCFGTHCRRRGDADHLALEVMEA